MVRSNQLWKIVLVSILLLPVLLGADTQYEITLEASVTIPYSYEYVQVTQDSLLRFWDLEIETDSITVNTFTLDRQGNLTAPEQALSAPNEHEYETPLSYHSQFCDCGERICVGCNHDSLLTLFVFEGNEYRYEREYRYTLQDDECQRRAQTLLWDTNTFLIALDQSVIRCNLDENLADTLMVFGDDWPNEWFTELYPLSDQYLIVARNGRDWYLMDSNLELLQEIDTEEEYGFTFFIFESAYPAEAFSGGYLISLYDGGFTEYIIYVWVEDGCMNVQGSDDLSMYLDTYPHYAYPTALNETIFFYTELGAPLILTGEYDGGVLDNYNVGIGFGRTVAKMDSYCAMISQQNFTHRVRIYDHTFPEYHEEEFSITAPLDPQYHPSMWYNYTMQRHVFFERRYSSFSGENSRFYIFYIDRYQPNSDQDISKPDLALSCYPNPFNPELTVSYSIPQNADVEIAVYNIKGQKVRSLQNEYRDAGDHQVVWDGRNESGQSASSGLYFVRISCGPSELIRKAILLK